MVADNIKISLKV